MSWISFTFFTIVLFFYFYAKVHFRSIFCLCNFIYLIFWPQHFRYYSYPSEEIDILDLPNPMCEAFPRVASCTFYKVQKFDFSVSRWQNLHSFTLQYGSGGRVVGHQALCILALNIVIDKVYLVLWWWYIIITILGSIRIICRIFQCLSSKIRFWLMKIKMHR